MYDKNGPGMLNSKLKPAVTFSFVKPAEDGCEKITGLSQHDVNEVSA